MKKLLKMSLLGLVITASCTFSSCGDGKKAPDTIDTAKVDTAKADATAAKADTTPAKKDTTKK